MLFFCCVKKYIKRKEGGGVYSIFMHGRSRMAIDEARGSRKQKKCGWIVCVRCSVRFGPDLSSPIRSDSTILSSADENIFVDGCVRAEKQSKLTN